MVPEVPREMLHCPSPTVPVPTAAAALSPAPATTLTSAEKSSSFATSGFNVPTTSQLSYNFGSCSSFTSQISIISLDQQRFFTSRSNIPDASETSVQKDPESLYAR